MRQKKMVVLWVVGDCNTGANTTVYPDNSKVSGLPTPPPVLLLRARHGRPNILVWYLWVSQSAESLE